MNKRGFTLIELMITIVMLTVMILALGRFTGMFQNATAKATILSTMTSIAKERLELIRGDPRYTTLVARYNSGASADTTGFPGYSMIQRKTILARDQAGGRDFTTITVRVFTNNNITKDTVSLTAVMARP